jgi:hypothetical protein
MSLNNFSFERAGRRYEVHHPRPEHAHEAPPYQTQLIALNDDYTLTCSPDSGDEGLRCRFSVGADEWAYVISSRYAHQYRAMMPGFNIFPAQQLIEVGAGLSEPVVQWADHAARLSEKGPKPVVIDPADYVLMNEMLEAAMELAPQEEHIARVLHILRTLKQRCTAILDPERIRLLPHTLKRAHKEHAELQGSADVVVDAFAAATYVAVNFDKPDVAGQRRRARERAFERERSFLKPEGKLFHVVPAHHS